MSTEQAAYGIVTAYKDEQWKFLLLLQDTDVMNWSFPKGKHEGKETPLETAKRELSEETGITEIQLLDAPLINEIYDFTRKGETFSRVNKYFIGIVNSMNVTVQKGEIFEYRWATYEEAKELFVFKKEARTKVLEEAYAHLRNL